MRIYRLFAFVLASICICLSVFIVNNFNKDLNLNILMSVIYNKKYELKLSNFDYEKSPGLNPLKGYVPQRGTYDYDYSMEYLGIWLKDFYTITETDGVIERSINTSHINYLLDDVASRGHCAIIRPIIYYPGNGDSCLYIGNYLYNMLMDMGEIYCNGTIEYPNFNNQILVDELVNFVQLFGEMYDGDPRIGFIQLGLYGAWGEWNLGSVKQEHLNLVKMSEGNLEKIVKAYDDFFNTTPLLSRNPTMGNVKNYNVGFHGDNYLFNSSDYRSAEWDSRISQISSNYVGLKQFKDFMDETNTHNKWKTVPYGAEISGIIYQKNASGNFVFDCVYEGETFEVFKYCQNMFHTSFIMGCGPNAPKKSDVNRSDDYKKLMETARLMGYEIGITSVSQQYLRETLTISITIKNYGCAPFYYNWEFGLYLNSLSTTDNLTFINNEAKLLTLLPNKTTDVSFNINILDLKKLDYNISFEIINPLKKITNKALDFVLANNNKSGGVNKIGVLEIL